jgi:hypothetical protein
MTNGPMRRSAKAAKAILKLKEASARPRYRNHTTKELHYSEALHLTNRPPNLHLLFAHPWPRV